MAIDYKKGWSRRLEHRKRHGLLGVEPVPHPDDIQIDFHTGEVEIMTSEEKAIYENMPAKKKWCEEEIKYIEGNC